MGSATSSVAAATAAIATAAVQSEAPAPLLKRAITAEQLRALSADTAAFFSVIPKDVMFMLCAFMGQRRPRVAPFTHLQRTVTIPIRSDASVQFMCMDESDNFVLVDRSKDEVNVYNTAGALIKTVGGVADHAGPIACVVDSRGTFYVSEHRLGCVRIFNQSGVFKRDIGATQIGHPCGLDLSNDEALLYVACAANGFVYVFNISTGDVLTQIGVLSPRGVAVLSTGQIAVSSGLSSDRCLYVLNQDGSFVRKTPELNMMPSYTLVVDADDNIYVEDLYRYAVYVHRPAALDSYVEKPTALRNANGFAICRDGSLALFSGVNIQLFSGVV
jgi:hypothetical protein